MNLLTVFSYVDRYVWDKDMGHEWITIALMILTFVVMDRVEVGIVMVALSLCSDM